MLFLAIFFPGIYFLIRGKIFSAIFAIALEIIAILTFLLFGIGFFISIALAIWGATSHSRYKSEQRIKNLERKVRASQAMKGGVNE